MDEPWFGPCCSSSSAAANQQEPESFSFNREGAVIKRVPKASRIQAAKLLTEILQKVVMENSLAAWQQLFNFARSCFMKPKRAGKKSKSLASVINRQIKDFTDNDIVPPGNSVMNKKRKHSRSSKAFDISSFVSSKLALGDVKGAVRILSSDSKVLESSAEVINQLKDKHPDLHPDCAFPPAPSEGDCSNSITVSVDDITRSLKSFKNGSSGGPDGLTPQHLKDLTSGALGETSRNLLQALVMFTNGIVLCGNIPSAVCSSFFGATLIALSKKDGGVRPIAIGNTLRRLCAKACMLKISQHLPNTFQPHQMGVGTPSGAEVVVHACRNFINKVDSDNILLKIDFKNAFNSVRRDVLLHEVYKLFPQIYPFIYQAYASSSNLFFGNETLFSKEGVQQGDPLGPFLFSLSINNLISSCKSDYNMWYLDDGTLGGKADVVFSDFQKILSAENSLGLKVNPAKCELISLNSIIDVNVLKMFEGIAPEIKSVKHGNMTLLGAPVMPSAVDMALESKLCALSRLLEQLDQVDAHDALFLLRNCFAIPKLTYVLRTSACFQSPLLKSYDSKIRCALEKVLNIQLSGLSWEQCTLPVRFGGLGIRSAEDIVLPAFLSSIYACAASMPDIFHITSSGIQDPCFSLAFLSWSEKSNILFSPQHPQKQKSWDIPLCQLKLNHLLEASNTILDKSRLLAVSAPHASHWLNAIPIPSLGLKMDNRSLRIACGLRLGSPLCQPHECICGTQVESTGVHGLSCRKSAGRFSRHFHVNNLIRKALESAHVPTILEPQGVSRTDGKRPDGMTIFPWRMGKCMVWDFTCSDTFAPSHLEVSSNHFGKVAERAEQAKLTKYEQLERDFEIVPICVETMGPWGPSGLKFVCEVGRRISEESGEPRSTVFLMQAIGMAIQRGNAASVLGTVCKGQHLEEMYYL